MVHGCEGRTSVYEASQLLQKVGRVEKWMKGKAVVVRGHGEIDAISMVYSVRPLLDSHRTITDLLHHRQCLK